jgi:predicted transcriptional regulator
VTTRFDVERVVCASDLPPSERLVLFVLLQHADNDPVIIPAKFTPSLSGLASETGLDRTTVARILSRLESQGWVHRQRPPVEESRKGVRTRYQLTVPDRMASGVTPPGVVASDHQASGVTPPEVVASRRIGSGVTPPRSTQPLDATHSTQRARARSDGSRNGKPGTDWLAESVDFVTERLTAITGRTYDRRDITDSITAILRGRKSGTPAAFIRGCVEKNVLQFEPTPMPQRYQPEGNPT